MSDRQPAARHAHRLLGHDDAIAASAARTTREKKERPLTLNTRDDARSLGPQ